LNNVADEASAIDKMETSATETQKTHKTDTKTANINKKSAGEKNGGKSESSVSDEEVENKDIIITFSHFLPRKELILGYEQSKLVARNVTWNFSRIAGSLKIDHQLRKLGSSIHVYGHSHRNVDAEIEGVRYVGAMMGYPRERQAGQCIFNGLKLVWEEEK